MSEANDNVEHVDVPGMLMRVLAQGTLQSAIAGASVIQNETGLTICPVILALHLDGGGVQGMALSAPNVQNMPPHILVAALRRAADDLEREIMRQMGTAIDPGQGAPAPEEPLQ